MERRSSKVSSARISGIKRYRSNGPEHASPFTDPIVSSLLHHCTATSPLFVQIAPGLDVTRYTMSLVAGADTRNDRFVPPSMDSASVSSTQPATSAEDKLMCQIQDAGGIKDNTCRICRQGIQTSHRYSPRYYRRLTQLVPAPGSGPFLVSGGGTVLTRAIATSIPH